MNEERYRQMIKTFLKPYLDYFDVGCLLSARWCHITYKWQNNWLLQETSPGHLISRFGDVNWPPWTPDLMAPDDFFWWFLKDRVYGNHPTTITQLKQNVCAQVSMISNDLCGYVMQHAIKRAKICNAARDGHIKDTIFKL